MARRGRPIGSATRQNIVNILSVLGSATGYDIFKIYRHIYGKITVRSIYYNLHTGVLLDLFSMSDVREEQGSFSWGPKAEKKYYTLTPKAKITADDATLERIRAHVRSPR